MKRAVFLGILMALFSLSAYALNLSVPEAVPAGSSFSIIVGINESNFDEIKVFLNDVQIFSQSMAGTSVDSAYVSLEATQGNKRILLINPLSAGTYTAKAQILDAGSVVSEEEASIEIFTPMQSSDGESLKHDIEILKEELGNVKASNDELSTKIQELQNKLSDFEDKIGSFESEFSNIKNSLAESNNNYESLSASLNELKQSISAANVALTELRSKNADLNSSLSALSGKVNSIEEQQARVTTGFVTFGQGVTAISVLLVVILIVAFYLRKRKETQAPLFEEPGTEADKDEEIASALVGEEPKPRGRWAYTDEETKENEERRFSLGDLIKRD